MTNHKSSDVAETLQIELQIHPSENHWIRYPNLVFVRYGIRLESSRPDVRIHHHFISMANKT